MAYEFCRRYYTSHGIAPWVIAHEGLGYYGIQLNQIHCCVNNPDSEAYGRLTIGGDVENWRRGSPGDHGLSTIQMCSSNISTEEIVKQAVAHMDITPIPDVSHLKCRHKRWGASYELCFEIATILALRNEPEILRIWNHPDHIERSVKEMDPKLSMKEHPGAFIFSKSGKKLLLACDGRLLDGSGLNIWYQFMKGDGVTFLADLLEERLDL